MSEIEERGTPPVPTLISHNLAIHAIVRMVAEVGRDKLIRETPLTPADLEVAASYYAQNHGRIDGLLTEERASAEALSELLTRTRPNLTTEFEQAKSSGRLIPLDELPARGTSNSS